jgi:hypothetical protein
MVMAKTMAAALHAHYPGHLWAVACDGQIGFADVRNLALSGTWGFRIRLSKMYSASAFEKQVVMAGGELLERYKLKRGRLNEDHLLSLKADFAGRLTADL